MCKLTKFGRRIALTAGHINVPNTRLDAIASSEGIKCGRPALRSAATVHDAMIEHFGRVILAEMSRETSSGPILVDAALTMLCAWLLQPYTEFNPAAVDLIKKEITPRRLSRVLDCIETHLDGDFSLADLSKIACMSEFHFSRTFSAAVGAPPYRYVSQIRLERAKTLITIGRTSLAEIALASGFSSQAAFSRAFRRTMGLSPGEFRRLIT